MTDALTVLAALKLDDGRRWGDAAEPFQWDDARAVLTSDDGPHLHWLGRPKGGSKSTDVSGFGIAWLLTQAPAMVEAYAVAADQEQANRLLDRARGFIARTPELAGRITVQRDRIMGPEGARIVALAADVAGSEGLLTPLVLVDELPNWSDTPSARAMWTSIVSAVPKWPGMRLVVIGHAGDPGHWSHKVYDRAKASPQWRVNDVPGPLPWVRPEDLEEQRALLLPSQFERRHMNRWVSGEDRLATREDVDACATLDGPQRARPGVHYAVGVDLGHKRDRAVIVVAHLEQSPGVWVEGEHIERAPKVVVDRKFIWKPTKLSAVDFGEVEQSLIAIHQTYGRPRVRMDPWQGAMLGQRLRGRGLRVEEFTFSASSVGRLAATLYGLLRDRRLALDNTDEELLDELSSVQIRETGPGVFRMDHSSSGHDDQAVALALAATALLERDGSSAPGMLVTTWQDRHGNVTRHSGPSSDSTRAMIDRLAETGSGTALRLQRERTGRRLAGRRAR